MDGAAPVLASPRPAYSVWQLVRYALRLGALGFGGPVALVGYMYRDLVEQRHWISEEEYKQGLTLAQLAPGPLAAQLAIYLGFCHYGVLGASLVGAAFILPSFLMVVALGGAYKHFGGLGWVQSVFYAVGACVIGIITLSAQKLARKTMGRDRFLWVIFLVLFLATWLTERESVPLILLAGAAAWLVRTPPAPLRQTSAWLPIVVAGLFIALGVAEVLLLGRPTHMHLTAGSGPGPVVRGGPGELGHVFWFFAKAGSFVFGSGLAIVPFLYGGVVGHFHWLSDRQFLDAVAVAMITPGPVVITSGFIGYLVAGLAGACVAAFATFFPCYLFTIIPAPLLRRYGAHPVVAAIVSGITAGATGAIAGSVIILGKRSIVDWPTALIAVGSYLLLWKTRKIPEPVLVFLAALLGLVLHVPGRG